MANIRTRIKKHMLHWANPKAGPIKRFAAPGDCAAAGETALLATAQHKDILMENEIVLLVVRPSTWLIVVSSFRFCVIVGLIGIALNKSHWISSLTQRESLLGVAVALVMVRLVWALMAWTSHMYLLTNYRIVSLRGVQHMQVFQASLRKITRATLFQRWFEKILGLGTIGFSCAEEIDPASLWLMISRPKEVHAQITEALRRAGS